MRNLDVIIMGAGPAGLSAGLKLLQLGRRVAVVSIQRGQRRSQLETIPNIAVLAHAFPSQVINDAAIVDPARVGVSWWLGKEKRTNPVTVIERNLLDPALLAYAQSAGLEIHLTEKDAVKPSFQQGWNLMVNGKHLRSSYLIDATGRYSSNGNRQPLVSWRQVSITGEAVVDPVVPGLWTESLPGGWIWAIRGKDGKTSISLFCDPLCRNESRSASDRNEPCRDTNDARRIWAGMIGSSRINRSIKDRSTTVTIRDVSPSAVGQVFKNGVLLVGDAALARDPLGSQGLSATVSEAQGAAIGLHTLLPDASKEALVSGFLEQRHSSACIRHKTFLGESYGDAPYETPFWTKRREKISQEVIPLTPIGPDDPLIKSSIWRLQETAILDGDTIDLASCLCSENESVRWLAGIPVERLLRYIDTTATPGSLLALWQRFEGLSEPVANQALRWMISRQVLVTGY